MRFSVATSSTASTAERRSKLRLGQRHMATSTDHQSATNLNTLEELRCLRLRHTLLSNSSSGEEGCSGGPQDWEIKTWGFSLSPGPRYFRLQKVVERAPCFLVKSSVPRWLPNPLWFCGGLIALRP